VLDFLTQRSRTSSRAVVVLIIISGLASGLLLGVVNTAAEHAANGIVQLHLVALFAAVLTLFVIAKRAALSRASVAAEAAIRDIRIDLSEKIRRSELLSIEGIGRSEIYARLTQDTSTISQSMPVIFNGYQSAVVVASGLLYMLWTSLGAFLLTATFLALGAWVHLTQQRRTVADLMQAVGKETQFFESLSHLLGGFKEIRLNRRKNDDVFAQVRTVSEETEHLMSRTVVRYIGQLVVTQLLIYLVIAILVFVLPTLEFSQPETVLKLTATILFMVGPLEILIFAHHTQSKAKVALGSIESLEKKLASATTVDDNATAADTARFAAFQRIELKGVVFRYPDQEHRFQVGPLDLTIARGETTFIVGGNGCGKSTLLKVLTGLYQPVSGLLLVDGTPLAASAYPAYRELFSCIFADFHLFDRLYGMSGVDPTQVQALIARMGLADKTDFRDGRFTNLDLSTGQRKRLALVAALIEDRPIYVFDEWAADQDPEFRKRYYEEFLPELKRQGKTVIAVSHDDRYFDRCDQLLKMDYGTIAFRERPTAG
jgi:putative ATP-binding cassette transporter